MREGESYTVLLNPIQRSIDALPVVLVFVLSYIVASAFVSVFDTGVDTIFLSFCLDEKVSSALLYRLWLINLT